MCNVLDSFVACVDGVPLPRSAYYKDICTISAMCACVIICIYTYRIHIAICITSMYASMHIPIYIYICAHTHTHIPTIFGWYLDRLVPAQHVRLERLLRLSLQAINPPVPFSHWNSSDLWMFDNSYETNFVVAGIAPQHWYTSCLRPWKLLNKDPS